MIIFYYLKELWRQPVLKKMKMLGAFLVLASIITLCFSPQIYVIYKVYLRENSSLERDQKIYKQARPVAKEHRAVQDQRYKLYKELGKEYSKDELKTDKGIVRLLHQDLIETCLAQPNPYCVKNANKINEKAISKKLKGMGNAKFFAGFTKNKDQTNNITKLVELHSLTTTQLKFYKQLEKFYAKSLTPVYTEDAKDLKPYDLKREIKVQDNSSINSELSGLAFMICIFGLLASGVIFVMFALFNVLLDIFFGIRLSPIDTLRLDVSRGKKFNRNTLNSIVIGKGQALAVSDEEWDLWDQSLKELENEEQEQIERKHQKLNDQWTSNASLLNKTYSLQTKTKAQLDDLDVFKAKINDLCANLSVLPIKEITHDKETLQVHLAGYLSEEPQELSLVFYLNSLTNQGVFKFALKVYNETVLDPSSLNSAKLTPALLNKLLQIQQAAYSGNFKQFFSLLAAGINKIDDAVVNIDLDELAQKIFLNHTNNINELLVEAERKEILANQAREILAKIIRENNNLEMGDLKLNTRFAKWVEALTQGVELEVIEKLKLSLLDNGLLEIETRLTGKMVKGNNGKFYQLPNMRVVSVFVLKDSGLILKSTKCYDADINSVASHPHIYSKGNPNACFGHADEPIKEAAKQDDLFSFLHILSNWSQTVANDRCHQERLRAWCNEVKPAANIQNP